MSTTADALAASTSSTPRPRHRARRGRAAAARRGRSRPAAAAAAAAAASPSSPSPSDLATADAIAAETLARDLTRDEIDALISRASLDELVAAAGAVRALGANPRVVTFSPKVFVPLTFACRDACGYCTFAKDPSGAFYTLVPIRPRPRGERRSLRTFAVVSLRPQGPNRTCT
jgi:hypothetical protein